MVSLKRLIIVLLVSMVGTLGLAFTASGSSDKKPVRIGYLQSDLHQLACWVALEKGFFTQEGVDVEVAGIFKCGPEEMTGFAAGGLDVAYVGEAPATMAVAHKTASVVVLAQANTEGSAIVVKKGSNIKKVSDLAGKTVAVPGHAQVQDFLLRKALVQHKIDMKLVNIIVLKPPEMIGALKTSQIDAFIAWEPYIAKAVTMNVGEVLINSGDIWKDHPCCVLVIDTKVLEKNMEKATAIVRAHVRATDFINRNGEEAIKIGVKYTGMDEETVRLAMENINYTYVPSIEGEIEYVNFLNRLKYLNVGDPMVFTHKFINAEILQEIIKK